MISAILTLIIAFLSLIVLMIIHEFGHFIIAKKFGVKVEEFGIGYPPRIFGKKVGETVYSLNWVPLGAFVKIHGEGGGVDDYRSFSNLKIWKRVLIVIGGVAAFCRWRRPSGF
jgi:regulator of sigma E protease